MFPVLFASPDAGLAGPVEEGITDPSRRSHGRGQIYVGRGLRHLRQFSNLAKRS